MIVATSVPVLGASPGSGVTGAAVFGGGSRFVSLGCALGVGTGGALLGLGGCGLTGAGFSTGGVGFASRGRRFCGAGAGAATSSTAYEGGVAFEDWT